MYITKKLSVAGFYYQQLKRRRIINTVRETRGTVVSRL